MVKDKPTTSKTNNTGSLTLANNTGSLSLTLADVMLAITQLRKEVSDLTDKVRDLEAVNTLNVSLCDNISSLSEKIKKMDDSLSTLKNEIKPDKPRNICTYSWLDDFDVPNKAY
jgi:hypothetical protein